MLREQTAGEQRELLGRGEVEMSPKGTGSSEAGRAESCGQEKKGIPGGMNSLCKGSEA